MDLSAASAPIDENDSVHEEQPAFVAQLTNHDALQGFSPEERSISLETLAQLSEYPFLFAVVTGTHHYGFTSPDSDIDVRGAFVVPSRDHLGLKEPVSHSSYDDVLHEREVDCVAFEIGRYLRLVLNHSGNLLEELFSPLVIHDGGYLTDLRQAVHGCLTKGIVRHYYGFFDACLKKIRKRPEPEVKTALYAARIAMTGITLLREGRVEAHLPTLNRSFGLDYIDEWISLKTLEHIPIPEGRQKEMIGRLVELRKKLNKAAGDSILPEEVQNLDALHDLLVQIRLDCL